MPDIIEETEGEGNSAIQRRANALVLARAAAAAARANNNANNNAGGGGGAVAVPEGAPAAPAVAAGGPVANNEAAATAEITQVAAILARLTGVDARPMFRRLGVRRSLDVRYIREKDLDGLPRITPIQKRKVWAVLKYVATDNPPLTSRTTLSEIAKTLNANKKKDKETAAAASSSSTTAMTTTTAIPAGALVPMVQVSRLEPFDGSHPKWVLWKNKSKYQLAATNMGLLMQEGEVGEAHAKKNPGQDYLLFNLLAEAIVTGSAKHLIYKAEQLGAPSPHAPAASTAGKKPKASGRSLWNLLLDEYSQGPMAFWILSDARRTLQKLHLVGSTTLDSNDNNSDDGEFVTTSAHEYVNRFRSAKDTLTEFHQALPDAFLASTFVEHVYDEKLETIKKQLLHDVSTKNVCLEDCIKELLMSDHMLRVRQNQNNNNNTNRKRLRPDETDAKVEPAKRLRLEQEAAAAKQEKEATNNEEPDEATS